MYYFSVYSGRIRFKKTHEFSQYALKAYEKNDYFCNSKKKN